MESMNRRTFKGNIGIEAVRTAQALACPMASRQAEETDFGRILPLSDTKAPLNHRRAKIRIRPVSVSILTIGGPRDAADTGSMFPRIGCCDAESVGTD